MQISNASQRASLPALQTIVEAILRSIRNIIHLDSATLIIIKCFDDSIFPPKLVKHTAASPVQDISQIFVDRLEVDLKKIYENFLTSIRR